MLKLVSKTGRLVGIGLTVFAAPICVFADDLEVTAVIDKVTVFLSGAEVTRSATVAIPAGGHRLIFADLPPDIDPARLQLSIGNDGVRLGNLQLEEVHRGDLVSLEEQRLQRELSDLLFARQEILDEIESANTQLKLLDSLATGAVGGQQASLGGDDLSALLSTLATSSREARQVIRQANQGLETSDRAIEQKRFELSQVATQQQSQQVLTVSVDAASAIETQVSFTYPVYQAAWTWLYEARLDTESRRLDLERKVSVAQTTGEDWANVELNITTARPNENTETPQLGSLLVDIYQPQPLATFQLEDAAEQRKATGSTIGPEASMTRFADVNASQYLVDFRIPGRVDIAADSQPQILPIDQRGLPVELVIRAVPELDTSAYLEARFTFEEDVPIQGGIMQLYRDGSFIGKRAVPDFLPEEEISLAFGKDDRVRIETRVEQEESRSGGTFRRNAIEDHRVRYELTSFHSQSIELEVLARIPVAQNATVEVEIANDATAFDEENVDGNTGVILWRQQAEPTQTVEIKHFYTVMYPRDVRLNFWSN